MMPEEFDEKGSADPEQGERERRWSEGVLRDTLKKAVEKGIEAGIGTLRSADSALRGVTLDGKLPKELIGYVFATVDETKNATVRVVAKEVRDFLEATDIAGEFYKALTSLSFEVKTEVRFIPNDAGGIRPQVRARAVQKRKRRKGVVETEQIIPPEDTGET
ncbi:MAG: hypothetical protein JRJ80_03610 [Deltaproteobacteria bacterium]|nr:hypothetical protein [Deltaproteobacteria bacterium]MBW2159434.1 hypothetical protein [Deltaproteobacteria bacterium]